MNTDFLFEKFLGITVYNYGIAAILLLLSLSLKRYLSNTIAKVLFKLLNRHVDKKYLASFQQMVLTPFQGLIATIFLFLAITRLAPLVESIKIIDRAPGTKSAYVVTLMDVTEFAFFFALIFYFTYLFSKILDFVSLLLIDKFIERKDKERQQVYPLVKDILKVLIWTIGIFIILKVAFKVDVTALVAGLGIGGIAVAFALKDSLENLLASILIMIDKPFLIGDWIKVNGVEGNVEKLGFRNTMVRSFDKTVVSIPNKQLINTNLENFSQRGSRRVKLEIGAQYGLSEQTLRKVADMIKANIEQMDATTGSVMVELDRFADSSIVFLIIYYVNLEAADDFGKVKENINYMIYNTMFTYANGMPFPTTVQIQGVDFNEVTTEPTR